MENADRSEHCERRRREVPPGPRTRAAESHARLEEKRRTVVLRQRRSCVRRNSLNSSTEDGTLADNQSLEKSPFRIERSVYHTTVNRHAAYITEGFITQLLCLFNAGLRVAILERVFSSVHIRSLLPEYYPSRHDVQAER